MIKKLLRLTLILTLLGLGVAFYLYRSILGNPVVSGETIEVTIPSGSSYTSVVDNLLKLNVIQDEEMFHVLADRMNLKKESMRSGRFLLQENWTIVDVIRHLRNGKQEPVDVVLTTERESMNVAAKAARFIEADSLEIATLFRDQAFLDSIGYTAQNLMSVFIPNTYEFFWNTSAEGFMERMLKEHKLFWSKDNRLAKAEALNLTPQEVYTLASIIEKETLQNSEKKRMAGVYLNRLRIGMLLQADPTSVFATRDFTVKRVLDYHTNFDSPYNTYVYAGLPPGPITMSSIASIDAVLNPESHKYMYFCARGDASGLHNFAETLSAHNRNAALYKRNLAEYRINQSNN